MANISCHSSQGKQPWEAGRSACGTCPEKKKNREAEKLFIECTLQAEKH